MAQSQTSLSMLQSVKLTGFGYYYGSSIQSKTFFPQSPRFLGIHCFKMMIETHPASDCELCLKLLNYDDYGPKFCFDFKENFAS